MSGPSPVAARRWSLQVSLLFVAIVMPVLFSVQFGYVDGYGYAFTAFLMLLMLAVELVPRYTDRFAHEPPPAIRRRRIDFLGVVWLLSIPFAPFFSWLLTNGFEITPANWRLLHGARAATCVAVPLICVLPLLRYLRRPHVAFGLGVLFLGTAFPVVTGLPSAIDVVRGPQWQTVDIRDLRDISFRTRAGTRVDVPNAFAFLADGRTLRSFPDVGRRLHVGRARLLVLRALGQIIDVGNSHGLGAAAAER